MKEKPLKNYLTVEALLKSMNLTLEERELHKELIKECLVNEQKINEYAAAAKKNIKRINTVLEEINKNMAAMEEALEELTKGAEELSLRIMSSDEFYRE